MPAALAPEFLLGWEYGKGADPEIVIFMKRSCEVISMNEQIREYLKKYPCEIADLFQQLRQLIYESVSSVPEEKLWARMPSYCVGDSFVRLIPFKDHINIEANAIMQHKEELAGFRITPKGMMQIYVKQRIPADALKRIFSETLGE